MTDWIRGDLSGYSVAQLKHLNELGRITRMDIPEHKVWIGMIQRCHNPRNKDYHSYGGRGIRVFQPWRKDYWTWFKYVGRRPVIPGFVISLDRIDNNGSYVPNNVRWASASEQANNIRPEFRGDGNANAKLSFAKARQIRSMCEQHTNDELAEIFGIHTGTINAVINNRLWRDPDWKPPSRRALHSHGVHTIIPEQAGWIKHLVAQGYSVAVIAKVLGVSDSVVSNIKYNGSWAWVEPIPFVPEWPRTFKRRL